jgi:polyisoprenoid-binding protein YceI
MRFSSIVLAASAALSLNMLSAHAETTSYAVEPSHTFVTFEISHFGTSTNRGRFDQKEGTVQLDTAAKTGKVDLTIQANSVNTGTAAFNKHLQSPDLFDAEQYPTLHFVGDKFSFNGDKVTEVAGNLTLRGKTNPVTLKALNYNCYINPMLKRQVCGGDFEATIDRTAYGMDYGIQYGFPKEVHLVIQVEAIKQ